VIVFVPSLIMRYGSLVVSSFGVKLFPFNTYSLHTNLNHTL
jgi:hypothetical protein